MLAAAGPGLALVGRSDRTILKEVEQVSRTEENCVNVRHSGRAFTRRGVSGLLQFLPCNRPFCVKCSLQGITPFGSGIIDIFEMIDERQFNGRDFLQTQTN